jgi:ketosteroid isomerase-like protein
MSGKNVDIVREAYEAVNQGDLDTAVSCIAPDMEYVASGAVPEATGVFLGPSGVKQFVAGLYEEFDEAQAEVTELTEAGDQVLVAAIARGRGKQSGVETRWETWQLWTLRDGKLVRGQGFTSRDDALAAARLGDQSPG